MSQLALTQGQMENILTSYVTLFAAQGLRCRLYQNDFQPEDDSVFGDFVEADFSGYDGYKDVSTWSAGGITWNAPHMVMPGPIALWTVTSGGVENTVYGYYVTDSADNLVWAQKADVPAFAGVRPGDEVKVTLEYSVRSEYHSTT